MGVRTAVCLACVAATTASAATGPRDAVTFLERRQTASGGFAERGESANAELTAWAVLGLAAAGAPPRSARAYLVAHEDELRSATDLERAILAESVVGQDAGDLVLRLRRFQRPSGAIGSTLNSTIWGVLALLQARRPAPPASVRYLLAHQARSGGWSWAVGGAPDSNDTAAAVEALRGARAGGAPIARALRYLARRQRRDGGFALVAGNASDAQSTAWAIQAFVAAGRPPPPRALAFLRRLQQRDGSFRYSVRYATTPAFVTAQVLPALARKPFPLR
jgi:prenyltransferase beta subunit